jgi:hypothetical protein
MNSGAAFDPTGRYRYSLWREWNLDLPRAVFLMLNPSRADATTNDPTISTCLGFATDLGFGSMEVVNLFAYRATDPGELRRINDPIGRENDAYITKASSHTDAIILAWGNHGALLQRADAVMQLLGEAPSKLFCFGITKRGHPRHPLYIKRTAPLRQWCSSCDMIAEW